MLTSPGCCLSLQVRLGDPEQLAKIMDTDPYFITQVGTGGTEMELKTVWPVEAT